MTGNVSKELNRHFDIKDLRNVKHYLDIQIEREIDGSFLLNQKRKISRMLEEYRLFEPKPVGTLMETGFLGSSTILGFLK